MSLGGQYCIEEFTYYSKHPISVPKCTTSLLETIFYANDKVVCDIPVDKPLKGLIDIVDFDHLNVWTYFTCCTEIDHLLSLLVFTTRYATR